MFAHKPTGDELVKVMDLGLSLDRYVSFRKTLETVGHDQAIVLMKLEGLHLSAYKRGLDNGITHETMMYVIEQGVRLESFVKITLKTGVTTEQALEVCRLSARSIDDYVAVRDVGLTHIMARNLMKRHDENSPVIRLYVKLRKAGKSDDEAEQLIREWKKSPFPSE